MYLIILMWLLNFVLSIFDKQSSNEVKGTAEAVKYSIIRSLFSTIFAWIVFFVEGKEWVTNIQTFVCSVVFGILMTIDLINYLFLAKTGMIALMSISNQAAALIIPSIAGAVLWSIPVSPLQWVFVITLLVSAYLLCSSSKAMYTGFSVSTVIMLLIRFMVGGFITLTMQAFSKVDGGVTSLFLLLAYIVSTAVLVVVFGVLKKEKTTEKKRTPSSLMVCGAVSALCIFLSQICTTKALTYIPPVIFTSCSAVGVITMSAIAGVLFYQEKLTRKSVFGIVGACISVVIINILE